MKSHQTHIKTFHTLLRSARLKATPARLRILEVLNHAHTPLSIQHINAELGAHTADMVTVYRTINALHKIGAVKQTFVNTHENAYELSGDHHHHVICTSCRRIEDVRIEDQFERYQNALSKKTHFKITDHSLEFFGVCGACQKKYER